MSPNVLEEVTMKVYRSPSVVIATLIVDLALIGLAIFYWVDPGPSPQFGTGLGIFYALVAAVSFANQITSCLKVDADGLSYVTFFRRKAIPWSDVRGIQASPHRTVGPLSSLRVETGDKSVNIRCISGTRKHIERIVGEVRAANPIT